MNEHPMPTDEELSAAIDGEADAELLDRIEASPEARARMAELQAASELVAGAPVDPLADDEVDSLIAGALDAPVAPARPVAARGRTPWFVAASVILLMAAGLTLIWAGRGDESDQASSAGSSESAALDSAADATTVARTPAEMAPASGGSTLSDQAGSGETGSPAFSASGPLYLGSFADGDALREATATSFAAAAAKAAEAESSDTTTGTPTSDARSTPTPPADAAVSRCADQLKVTLSQKAAPTTSAYATVDGREVLVYEFATTSLSDGKATTLVAAVGSAACEQVVIFER